MANVYTEIAEYQKAIEYMLKYVEKDIVQGRDSLLSPAFNSIGVNYNYLGQSDKALKFYNKAVETAEGDLIHIGGAYNNMANIYQIKGDLDLAKGYYKKSLSNFEQSNHYKGIVATVMNIGIIEMQEKHMEKALEYLDRARNLAKEKYDTLTYIIVCINLGDYYTQASDYQKSKECLNWALKNAKIQNARLYISESYKSLVNLYKTKEDYENAFKYLELFKASSDSIFNLNSNREYAELETKYSVREKDAENQLLLKEQQLTEAQYKSQQKYIWMLSGLVILAILFIGLFYLQRRKVAKAKRVLEAQNKEIKKSQKQLEDLNRQYEKLIDKYEGGSSENKPQKELS